MPFILSGVTCHALPTGFPAITWLAAHESAAHLTLAAPRCLAQSGHSVVSGERVAKLRRDALKMLKQVGALASLG